MTKVVITAAGKGTRLLPFTKEVPKEMMPIFSNVFTNNIIMRPPVKWKFREPISNVLPIAYAPSCSGET